MEHLAKTISTVLDLLFFKVISPIFSLLGRGLETVILQPLQILDIPAIIQVTVVGLLAGSLSLAIRRLLRVEEKEAAFRAAFIAKRSGHDDLPLISDWKSREAFAQAIDEDIDHDFNAYLAERFARHGLVYLLPIFLTLFWLEGAMQDTAVLLAVPENRFGIEGLTITFVFLVSYGALLIGFFRICRKRRGVIQ